MIKVVTMWQVWCDEPGCNTSTADNDDHWAYADIGGAEADWEGAHQIVYEYPLVGNGAISRRHYCDEHWKKENDDDDE